MTARLVLTTCPDDDVAGLLARTLVERRIAACVTRIPAVVSIYRWHGMIEDAEEVQLVIKTTEQRLPQLMDVVADIHPYEEPELLVLDVVGGSPGYIAWLESELAP